MPPALAQYLLSHGCNPDLVSSDGFFWRAMSRLLDILDRHPTPE